MDYILAFVSLFIAFLIFNINKKTYLNNNIDLSNRIKGFSIIIALIMIALALFFGYINV